MQFIIFSAAISFLMSVMHFYKRNSIQDCLKVKWYIINTVTVMTLNDVESLAKCHVTNSHSCRTIHTKALLPDHIKIL